MNDRVLLGFTGGIRSSILAVLLREQGYDVRGAYVDFSDFPLPLWRSVHPNIADKASLQRVTERARSIGLDLDVIPGGELFEDRITDAVLHACLNQEQVSPGIWMQSSVVMPALSEWAQGHGYARIATGHRCNVSEGEIYLSDEPGDHALQLAFFPRSRMENFMFPLGTFQQVHLKKLASQLGNSLSEIQEELHPAQHPYATSPEGWAKWAGEIIKEPFNQKGWVRRTDLASGLLEHQGIFRYPAGQLFQLPTQKQEDKEKEQIQLVISGFDLASGTLWVMPPEGTFRTKIEVTDLLWREGPFVPPLEGMEIDVQLGEVPPGIVPQKHKGRIVFHSNHGGRVHFKAPMPGIFKGSALVFSKAGRVLGSARVSNPVLEPPVEAT